MENRKQKVRSNEERANTVFFKMTAVFIALVALTVFLIRMGQNGSFALMFRANAMPYLMGVGALLFVGALVYKFICLRKRKDESSTLFSSSLLLGAVSAFDLSLLVLAKFDEIHAVIALFAAALLFFVYEIYMPDFFCFTVECVVGAVATALVGSTAFGNKNIFNILLVVGTVLAALTCITLMRRTLAGSHVKLADGRTVPTDKLNAAAVYIGAALALLAVAAVLLFGALVTYILAVLCGVYLLAAIYFTVKLI